MHVLLLHRPSAGAGRVSGERLCALLTDGGHTATYASLEDGDWRSAFRQPFDLVAVAGGDGAVRQVVLALADADDPPPFTILPLGTSNNVAMTLELIGELEELVAGWHHGERRPFGLAALEVGDQRTPFLESFGGGPFAELIARGEEVEERIAVLGEERDRALLLLGRLLAEAAPQHWSVVVDGEDASGDYVGIEVLNTRFAGPKVALAPVADPADGLLEVVFINPDGCDGLRRYVRDRLRLGSAVLPEMPTRRVREVRLIAPAGALHLDDEPWPGGDHPLLIRALPGALTALVPQLGSPGTASRVQRGTA